MNLTAKSNSNKLLIHRDMNPISSLDHSIDIILTPQFYTFIREELDVKFNYQAKQIAQSLFDDYLDHSHEYQYHVYKCDSSWCFLAYNIDKIDDFLQTKGIEKHRVSKIYFAQQLIGQIETPILIDDNSALVNIDNVITIVPTKIIDSSIEYNSLDIKSLKLRGGVTMGSSLNSYVSLKETLLLGTIFTILGGISLFEGERIKHSISKENAKLTELLDENPRYASSMVRESILSKYKPIDKIERLKRDSIKDISKLLSNKSELELLTIDKNRIKATIKAQNGATSREIGKYAKKRHFKLLGSGVDVKVEKKL